MRPNNWCAVWAASVALLAVASSAEAAGGPRVEIVIASNAPRLEQRAAKEVSAQLQRLYDAEVTTASQISGKAPHIILLGSPATNPAIQALGENAWPKLSDQGHLLRSVSTDDGTRLIVGGGSPIATLWAAYELGHRFGIRSLLFGDLDPVAAREFSLDGLDELWEPKFRVRAWTLLGERPTESAYWSLDDHRALLGQLAKLKFNRVILTFRPWQPFVDYEFEGVRKQSAPLAPGNIRVDGDTAGRGVFRGIQRFENPDLAGKETAAQRRAAAIALAQGLIDTAHDLGMSVGIAVSPLEFPKEFAQFLPGAQPVTGSEGRAIVPGIDHASDDSRLQQLARAQLLACTAAWPMADAFYLVVPKDLDWSAQISVSAQRLNTHLSPGAALSPADLSAQAKTLHAKADNAEIDAVHTQLVVAEFLHSLLDDGDVLRGTQAKPPEILFAGVHPALSPVIGRLQSPKIGALYAVGDTAHRAAETLEELKPFSPPASMSAVALPLAGDPRSVLPQMPLADVQKIVDQLQANGCGGYVVEASMIGELDPAVYYLSRAGSSHTITAAEARDELMAAVLGEAVVGRMAQGCEMIEQATRLVDRHDLGFARPTPEALLRHYQIAEEPPAWWSEARQLYLGAMNEMYRVNTRARQGGRPVSLYLARRYEFAFEYVNCATALRRAALAKQNGDAEAQFSELEKGLDSLHAALNAQAAVARNSSDRGVIAVLNEYGYRPLKREFEALLEQLDAAP